MLCVIVPLMYGLRPSGKGREAGKVICAVQLIPQPPTSFSIYNKIAGSAMTEVNEFSMTQQLENLYDKTRNVIHHI
jgi:hypothetical protein